MCSTVDHCVRTDTARQTCRLVVGRCACVWVWCGRGVDFFNMRVRHVGSHHFFDEVGDAVLCLLTLLLLSRSMFRLVWDMSLSGLQSSVVTSVLRRFLELGHNVFGVSGREAG